MGTYYRSTNTGHKIECFTPDDTDTEMYINTFVSVDMEDVNNRIKEKWPDAKLSDINIAAEYIHTDCLGYDLYDSSDYTNYIVITLKE